MCERGKRVCESGDRVCKVRECEGVGILVCYECTRGSVTVL